MPLAGGVDGGGATLSGGHSVQSVYGTAIGTAVGSGGDQFVFGSAAGTVVSSGGSVDLESGGILSTPTFRAGAQFSVDSGGVQSGFEARIRRRRRGR